MLDLIQLECFCAVVRSGSFSKASAILAMGQPGLSRQVRKLEEHVGSQLLYRNGRGAELTPSGSKFHETVSDLIAKLKEACDQVAEERLTPSGSVALGLPTSMAGLVGAPVLHKLRTKFPGIKLHLVDGFSGHVHEWLLSGRIDLAILHDARHTPAIAVEHLMSEELFLVGRDAPPVVTTENGSPAIAMSEIGKLSVIAPGPDHGLRRQLDRVAADAGIALNIANDIDSLTAMKELVRAGIGYTILPIGCVYREIDDGYLQAWRIISPSVINTLVLAAAQNRPFTSAMREVRAALRAEVAAISERQIGWQPAPVRAPKPIASEPPLVPAKAF
ncbi:LysR substrate-binding domain-containing protein [Beijerinckia sp. L45]|uniref:LysR family transcriptional regulator n=1 Tax=Beijerinckia sp. L45 TaxID=1641855 RepID=UPI00131DBFBA|nr:LysR substrate-binding domain-containing protein [Beijerinckia sp. L45]